MELVSRIGVLLAATTLAGASVFADSRPSYETRWHRGERGRMAPGSARERSRATRRARGAKARRHLAIAIARSGTTRIAAATTATTETTVMTATIVMIARAR